MWRDRTNLYISYRQSYAHQPTKRSQFTGLTINGFSNNPAQSEERRNLISSDALENDGDIIIEMDQLPPKWLDIRDEVAQALDDIAKKINQLSPLHSKHVLPGFEDDVVKKREEREIERLTLEITHNFQSCQRSIKKVEKFIHSANFRDGISPSEEVMARNLQTSLATRVGEVSAAFRKKQSVYLKKLRALSGMGSPNGRSGTPVHQKVFTDPSTVDLDADRSFSQSTLQQTAQKRKSCNDGAMLQREKEIEEIAQGIIELANIFQELQTMVIDQGTMLDRIDYNIEKMAVNVKAADNELRIATGHQRRTTKRKIIFLLILIIVGLLILLSTEPKRQQQEGHLEDPRSVQQPP